MVQLIQLPKQINVTKMFRAQLPLARSTSSGNNEHSISQWNHSRNHEPVTDKRVQSSVDKKAETNVSPEVKVDKKKKLAHSIKRILLHVRYNLLRIRLRKICQNV